MIPGIISARSSASNTLKVDLANFCNTSNVLSIAELRSCSPWVGSRIITGDGIDDFCEVDFGKAMS